MVQVMKQTIGQATWGVGKQFIGTSIGSALHNKVLWLGTNGVKVAENNMIEAHFRKLESQEVMLNYVKWKVPRVENKAIVLDLTELMLD